jgi:uncharacterized protein (TIGR02646 family)
VIRIKKPTQAPAILQNRGVKALRQLCVQYDADHEAHKGWLFDPNIYGAKSVKNLLRKSQNGKCAFCESKVAHIAYGDVEHFRPKGGYRQRSKDPLVQPGYYWLAYDWSNLLFCCQICNQRHKRNHFPLADTNQRAKSHHHDIRNEQPLFIHPAIEDPSAFLEFKDEYLRAIDGNPRGMATIDALGLNREDLAEIRRDSLAQIKVLVDCRELFANLLATDPDPVAAEQVAAIDARLVQCARDSAQYAAMVRAALGLASFRSASKIARR